MDDFAEESARRFAELLHNAGEHPAPGQPFAPPVVHASIYSLPGEPAGTYQYARWANPTWTALERALGLLEGAPAAIFPSGTAAVCALFAARLAPGDRLLLPADGYQGTREAAQEHFATHGILVEAIPTAEFARCDFAGVRLALVETPSNPGLELVDIADCARRAKSAGCTLAIDNTLATGVAQDPLALGADVVVASDTKMLNGHSDVVFGHLATADEEILRKAVSWRRTVGAIPGPAEAWLVERGLQTLEIRSERMGANAMAIARVLEGHPRVQALRYPGLPSHPQHALARRQMRGFGPLVAITLASSELAERFIQGCRYLRSATSFGGLHSSAERRARWGGSSVAPGFIRLSAGCEPTAPLVAEIVRALDAA
jgi:cystathionine gamma-lyase